jgi:adenylosuccinate synthase
LQTIVLLTGHTCTGKTNLALGLERDFGYLRIKTSDVVRKHAAIQNYPTDRKSLQEFGDSLDTEFGHQWIFDHVVDEVTKNQQTKKFVVDSIRTAEQLKFFRAYRDSKIIHVHLFAGKDYLSARFEAKHGGDSGYNAADIIKRESDIAQFKQDADIRINVEGTSGLDTLVRVAAQLNLYPAPDTKTVDVIVGGQYGSEGKGHIAAYLSSEYDFLMRVGGPNAGHTVSGKEDLFTYHQLPSGSKDTEAKILLGAGMTIYVPKLIKEIQDCAITPERLFIDPNAMIISEEDIENEELLRTQIGSTKSGSGSAAARRIMGRGLQSTLLAKDVKALRLYVGEGPNFRGSTIPILEEAFRSNKSVLLEGTQGSALSIYHGPYPHVTSRDTNVSGCLAEAGISPRRVRKVVMVIRPTPIRVADPEGNQGFTSGELKGPTTFGDIAASSGLDKEKLEMHEVTSTTGRDRKVGRFDWELFRKSCALNAPTDLVLTFADYIDSENVNARRFGRLSQLTQKFIEDLERVALAPVSMIAIRFPRTEEERKDPRSIIDRRTWRTNPH